MNNKQQKLFIYLLKLILIWLSWKLWIIIVGEQKVPIDERLFPALSAKWEQFNSTLVGWLMQHCLFILQKMGYWAYIYNRTLWIDPEPGVTIGNYCLGLQLKYYFIMLVLVTPMSKLAKLVGVLGGITIVWLLNIARVLGLVLISYHIPAYLYLAHDHIFNIIVFLVLIPCFILLEKHGK